MPPIDLDAVVNTGDLDAVIGSYDQFRIVYQGHDSLAEIFILDCQLGNTDAEAGTWKKGAAGPKKIRCVIQDEGDSRDAEGEVVPGIKHYTRMKEDTMGADGVPVYYTVKMALYAWIMANYPKWAGSVV